MTVLSVCTMMIEIQILNVLDSVKYEILVEIYNIYNNAIRKI